MKESPFLKITLLLSVLTFAFFIISEPAFAETGDLYERNKRTFDRELTDNQIERVKKYSYANNEFDCGTFDIDCRFEGVMYTSIIGGVNAVYGMIGHMVVTPASVVNHSVFRQYRNGFGQLSNIILAVFISWQFMKIVAMRFADSDDGMVAMNDKIWMIVVASVLLGMYDTFIIWVLNIQEMAVSAVINNPFSAEQVAVAIWIKSGAYGIMIGAIIFVALMVFSIAFAYRYVLFGFLFITGVIAIPTAVNDEYNYFSLWLKIFINNGVTLLLQALCFSVGFQAMLSNTGFYASMAFPVGVSFMILALTIPSMLGSLGASTGTSRSISTMARFIARRR